MTTTLEPIEGLYVDGSTEIIEDISFGKEIAKTLALSAATTAGMIGGVVVIGLTVTKVQKIRSNRRDKKAAEKALTVDVTDKTPANEDH